MSLGASVGVEREQLPEDELVISVAFFSKKKVNCTYLVVCYITESTGQCVN